MDNDQGRRQSRRHRPIPPQFRIVPSPPVPQSGGGISAGSNSGTPCNGQSQSASNGVGLNPIASTSISRLAISNSLDTTHNPLNCGNGTSSTPISQSDSSIYVGRLEREYHPMQIPDIPCQEGTSYIFGRAVSSDTQRVILCLSDFVSRQHCHLYFRDNKFWIRDLKSLNGTFLNEKKIIPHDEMELQSGDRIGLGVNVGTSDFSPEDPASFIFTFKKMTVNLSNSCPLPPAIAPFPAEITADIPMPPNFMQNRDVTNSFLVSYKLFPVSHTSLEYQVLSSLLWNSSTSITSIEQISNPELWNRFDQARREMCRLKSEDIQLLSQLGLNDGEVSRAVHATINCGKDRWIAATPYSDNMALLFHCTRTPENMEAILSQGLDERLGSKVGGRLGRGIYFSDNPQKSMHYAGSTGAIFVCAVLLGDCLSVDHLHKKSALVREPEKSGKQMRNHKDLFFDSIVSRPGETGINEFVIYNRFQCCPLYKVRYNPSINVMEGQVVKRRKNARMVRVGPYSLAAEKLPPVAWIPSPNTWDSVGMPQQIAASIKHSWPFLAKIIFEKMVATPSLEPSTSSNTNTFRMTTRSSSSKRIENLPQIVPPNPVQLDCPICCNPSENWKTLKCSHKLCLECHARIETTRNTMSLQLHTFVKCPFCQDITGVEIGTCPNGTMKVIRVKSRCAGYEDISGGTFFIRYKVPSDSSHRSQGLARKAYLPINEEGEKLLDLLKTAWDRRLCFTIGTSNTTGRRNCLVWNIHHKTARNGGVQVHGYPDPGYMTRAKQELKSYGIE